MTASAPIATRRTLLAGLGSGLAARAAAQPNWIPTRPIQIIVGFSPGGGSDIVARGVAQAVQPFLPVPVVVVNRPGAAGVVAAQQVAGAPPDGTQLLVTGGSESTSVAHYRAVAYDALRDFRHVILVTRHPLLLLVRNGGPIADIAGLIARARTEPNRVSFASSGIASLYQSLFLVLNRRAGTEMLHVPYTGGAPALASVAAGEVDCTCATPDECKGLVDGGTLRPIAVGSRSRAAEFPQVPTLIESGFDVFMENMKGLSLPAATPEAVVRYLYENIHRALATPAWRDFAQRSGLTTADLDGAAFTAAIREMSEAIGAAVNG